MNAPDTELVRQERVINQMTSMHAVLMGRYRFWGRAVTVLLLVLSVAASVLAFSATGDRFTLFGVNAYRTTWLGWFALTVVLLVLVEHVFDLRGLAAGHSDAVRRLAALRTAYRSIEPGTEKGAVERLGPLYNSVMESLPNIPERQFNPLKARHLRKVAVSRYLSDHPGSSARQARRAVKRSTRSE